MRKFILVTPVFPPKGGGGTQRMVKFVKYLRDHDWYAYVVTPSAQRSDWYDESPLAGVQSERVVRMGATIRPRSLSKRLLARTYPIDAYYPWASRVAAYLKTEPDLKADVIFTSGPPHSVHRVGAALKRDRNIKWIADFRDHYTLGPEYAPATALHA